MTPREELQEKLIRAIQAPEDDELFVDVVRTSMDLLSITDTDLAERFGVSRPSVNRWRNGMNAPHPAMRPRIYKELLKRAKV
jgi:transcriptional regulator with XRE-family HTH domain